MKAYRVNVLLAPDELRYCFALLASDDDKRAKHLTKHLADAIDRLNDDEKPFDKHGSVS